MTCVLIEDVCKRPADVKDFAFNWEAETFRYWLPGEEYVSGTRIRPSVANGFEFVANANGQSNAKREPKWVATLGETVIDGSMTWTCVALSAGGLRRNIVTSAWTPEDGTIGVANPNYTNTPGSQKTLMQVTSGVDGDIKDVTNVVTFSDGVILSAILRVTIDDEAD